jgi:cell wall-associated NlpC family hydrolase
VVTRHEPPGSPRLGRAGPAGAASSWSWWWAGRAGRGDGAGGAGRPPRPSAARPGHALPAIAAPERPGARPASGSRPARAVAFALAQRGKPYRWGAQGPGGFDCSGLTWAAWRSAGVTIPRTAAGQLAGLPRIRGRLRPGDLVIYRSDGPSRRHVAIVVGRGRMVEARGRGIPVRSTRLRGGWLGAVRPGTGP